VQNYQKAFELTQQALELDGENPDNHLWHGIACYRLERYQEAEDHLQACRRSLESKNKNVTVMLFYEAMCQAHRNKILAGQSLQRARETYARTNLKYRENHAGELSDLIWEAQHVVGGGGSMD
jgi:tetratricopeptide (TPR) repeat protein